MTRRTDAANAAIVGVADHAGWAVLVTVDRGGELLDRRRVELVEDGLPRLPHHHECQGLPLEEAVALVGRVRACAERLAHERLAALAAEVAHAITGIALRVCPSLPETVAERITTYSAQTKADTVMYRHALADAATARGWQVHWYDARRVFAQAESVLKRGNIEALLERTGAALGPPWQKDHRVAMAAAIAAFQARPAGAR